MASISLRGVEKRYTDGMPRPEVDRMTMGDRVVVMESGRIQQVGAPEELYDHPANRFVGGFIGTPAMGSSAASLVARLPREAELALDEPVTFAVDAACCHLFDPESGKVLR